MISVGKIFYILYDLQSTAESLSTLMIGKKIKTAVITLMWCGLLRVSEVIRQKNTPQRFPKSPDMSVKRRGVVVKQDLGKVAGSQGVNRGEKYQACRHQDDHSLVC